MTDPTAPATSPEAPEATVAVTPAGATSATDVLVEDVSIDGMCGVY